MVYATVRTTKEVWSKARRGIRRAPLVPDLACIPPMIYTRRCTCNEGRRYQVSDATAVRTMGVKVLDTAISHSRHSTRAVNGLAA
jgi:hypothetical protein